MKCKSAIVPGRTEPVFDAIPIDFVVKPALRQHQIIHGFNRGPDALVVGVLTQRMHDEMGHHMLWRRHADLDPIKINGNGGLNHLAGRQQNTTLAHGERVMKLEMDSTRPA
jgi:hypothetical protein